MWHKTQMLQFFTKSEEFDYRSIKTCLCPWKKKAGKRIQQHTQQRTHLSRLTETNEKNSRGKRTVNVNRLSEKKIQQANFQAYIPTSLPVLVSARLYLQKFFKNHIPFDIVCPLQGYTLWTYLQRLPKKYIYNNYSFANKSKEKKNRTNQSDHQWE